MVFMIMKIYLNWLSPLQHTGIRLAHFVVSVIDTDIKDREPVYEFCQAGSIPCNTQVNEPPMLSYLSEILI